jgi:peptide/nickel transport system substrate-binding protein
MKTKKRLFALLLTAVMLLTACGSANSSSSNSSNDSGSAGTSDTSDDTGEKVLNFGCQMYDDGSVNTAMQASSSWNCMRYGISEALFKFNDSMEVEPWLAESYTVSDDHTTWTIKLRDDVQFSDGCDLTATKVKETFDYLKEVGPTGSAKPEKYLEYEAVVTADDDANTVTIVTSQPYANLPGQLAYPVMAILDIEHTTDFDNGAIGTGPYMIDSFNGVGVGYDMVANPYYRETVPYDRVSILFMGDNSAKAMALQAGQVDLVENITNVSDIQRFQEDDDYTVDIASGVRCGFSWMNFNGVLGNKTLRQAILMAIDYDTICASRTIGGLYTPGFSVLPSTLSYGYENLTNPYAYDPEGAKQLLDEAGIVDTDGDGIRELDGENINLVYVSYENRLLNDFSDAHTQYLAEIGIGVTADYGSSDDQWSKLAAGEYDFNNNNWTTVGTGDPYEYMANWASATTYCGYSNPEYDELYEQLKSEMDGDKRAEIIERLQQILIDDAAVLIDGYYNSSMIYSKNVGYAHIHTADYYWLTTEIVPAD